MENSTLSKWIWVFFFEVSMILGWIIYTRIVYPLCPFQADSGPPSAEVVCCYVANFTAYAFWIYVVLTPLFRIVENILHTALAKLNSLAAHSDD
jgi:hypothetical protein